MAKEKAHIIAMLNGKPVGYIKSISYTTQKFSITKEKINAKGYTNLDIIHREIDFLAKIGAMKGYVFIYN